MEARDDDVDCLSELLDAGPERGRVLAAREGQHVRRQAGLDIGIGIVVPINVVGVDPDRRDARHPRPRYIAGGLYAGDGQKANLDAALIQDGRGSRLRKVGPSPDCLDALTAQQRERIVEAVIATVENVIVGAGHHPESRRPEPHRIRCPGDDCPAGAGRGARAIRIGALAIPEQQIHRSE